MATLNPTSGALGPYQSATSSYPVSFGPLNLDPHQITIFSSAGAKYIYAGGTNTSQAVSGKYGIFGFTIQGTQGELAPIPGVGLLNPQTPFGQFTGITMDGQGRYLYVSDYDSSGYRLRAFSISTTGMLQEGPVRTNTSATDWLVQASDPTGRYVYAWYNYPNGNIALSAFTIDGSTGALTEIAGSPFLVATGSSNWPFGSNALQFSGGQIAFSPSGKLLYASLTHNLFLQNGQTEFDTQLYAFSIDPVTGALAIVSGSPISLPNTMAPSMVMHPSGKFLYVSPASTVANTLQSILMFPIDTTNGALASSITVGGGGTYNYIQLMIDPSSNVLLARGQNIDSYMINNSNGSLTAASSLSKSSVPPNPYGPTVSFGTSVVVKIP